MRANLFAAAALTAVVVLCPSPAQAAILTCDAFDGRTFSDDTGSLPYRLYIPPGYDAGQKYPLVLFLHGAGERGTDNCAQLNNSGFENFASETAEATYHTFLLAPQCPGDQQWVDTPWGEGSYVLDDVPISPAMSKVVKILDALETEFSIDPDRLYVTGLSMGGFGTWDLIMRYPERFAAGVPMSGGASPTSAELVKQMPFWNFHGDSDGIVPTDASREMVTALRGADSPVIYSEYPGGHGGWDQNYATTCLNDWLFRQNRLYVADNGGVTDAGVCPEAGLDPAVDPVPRDGVSAGGDTGSGGTGTAGTGSGGTSVAGTSAGGVATAGTSAAGTGGSSGGAVAFGGTSTAGTGGSAPSAGTGMTSGDSSGSDGGCSIAQAPCDRRVAASSWLIALLGIILARRRSPRAACA